MRTIFWNVDTQHDFMRRDGLLYVPNAETIEGNLEKLTELARTRGIQVVNTADWHNSRTAEISDNPDFVNTFPAHCMEFTEGAEYVRATKPEDPYVVNWSQEGFESEEIIRRRNIVLYKDKFDVFAGTPHTERVLDVIKPSRAIVYGVATNVCVDFAVRGLLERKVEVLVPTDAIMGLPNIPMPYENWMRMGAKLTTVEGVYRTVN